MKKSFRSGSGLSGALWVVVVIMAVALPARAAMIMSPYLQAVSGKDVCVMVECDSMDPVSVQFGVNTTYGETAKTQSTLPTDTKPTTYVHRVWLSDLKPNTTYHYRATQDGTAYSTDAAFITAVPAGVPFKFAALGDFRTNTAIHEGIVAKIRDMHPAFSIYGGDLCGSGSYKMFKNEFFQPNELALDAVTPFFNSPGNHEGWTPNTKAFTQAPVGPKDAQGYYSFDYGDVHFLAINDEVSYAKDSAQWKFAKQDLESTKQLWKIVFFHQPAYCAGGHGENKGMILMTKQLFDPNKVNIVIAGHTHLYQHNLVNGIHHFVLGSAGAPLYNPGKADYVVKTAKAYHFAILEVNKNKIHMVVYKNDGSVLDTLDLDSSATAKTPAAADEWTTTNSGLKYKDEKVGDGQQVKAGDSVTVHYKGWLDDGKVFDTSMENGREPLTFTVGIGQVIKGWDEGIVGMKVGGVRELTIPASLAYGDRDMGIIPPKSTLHFQVTIISVKAP